jgi:hypothetical protein
MKLKTSNLQAIELAEPSDYPVLDLVLCGTELACELLEPFKHQKEKPTSEQHSFKSIFGLDHKFYYIINKYKNKDIVNIEVGIGYLIEQDDKVLLRRFKPMAFKQPNCNIVPVNTAVDVFRPQGSDEYIIVSSYAPTLLTELLIDPNCTIASSKECPINVIEIENNSVLGRLDGDIQSLSLNNISDRTIDLLSSYTKQLVLSCSQLDVKKIKTSSLQLKPSNRPQSKEGTLIYNEKNKTIEYYDGSQWRTLIWSILTDS